MPFFRASFVFIFCLLAPPSTTVASAAYTVTDLGTLGFGESRAWDVNDSGDATGRSRIVVDGYGHWHAYAYHAGTMNDLETLAGAGADSEAYGINNAGQIAGGAQDADNHMRAFRWTDLDGDWQADPDEMKDLGTLGGQTSFARDINDSGQVVGTAQIAVPFGQFNFYYDHAFRWTDLNDNNQADPGEMLDLGTLTGQASSKSNAWGINGGGTVVGQAQAAGGYHAFQWTEDYGMIDLGTLGGSASHAYDINDSDVVVGVATTAASLSRAFLWTDVNGDHASDPLTEMVDLGTLGGEDSAAYGINSAGDVVGYAQRADGAVRAFLYSNNSMTDLNDLIPVDSGWVLEEARAISDSGYIVGLGSRNGTPGQAFLLSIARLELTWAAAEPALWNSANWDDGSGGPLTSPSAGASMTVESGWVDVDSDHSGTPAGSLTVAGGTVDISAAGVLSITGNVLVDPDAVLNAEGSLDAAQLSVFGTLTIGDSGHVETNGPISVQGELSGNGTIVGAEIAIAGSNASVSPGSSIGTISVVGDVTIDSTAALVIEVQGNDSVDPANCLSDKLAVDGNLDLANSRLALNFLPGDENSKFGGIYTVASSTGTLTGALDTADLLGNIGEAYLADIDHSGSEIKVSLYNLADGDINLDGKVDVSDLTILSQSWDVLGSNQNTWLSGDMTFDGAVDVSDLSILSQAWAPGGVTLSGGEPKTTAIPEPGSAMMLLLAAAGLLAYRQRR